MSLKIDGKTHFSTKEASRKLDISTEAFGYSAAKAKIKPRTLGNAAYWTEAQIEEVRKARTAAKAHHEKTRVANLKAANAARTKTVPHGTSKAIDKYAQKGGYSKTIDGEQWGNGYWISQQLGINFTTFYKRLETGIYKAKSGTKMHPDAHDNLKIKLYRLADFTESKPSAKRTKPNRPPLNVVSASVALNRASEKDSYYLELIRNGVEKCYLILSKIHDEVSTTAEKVTSIDSHMYRVNKALRAAGLAPDRAATVVSADVGESTSRCEVRSGAGEQCLLAASHDEDHVFTPRTVQASEPNAVGTNGTHSTNELSVVPNSSLLVTE